MRRNMLQFLLKFSNDKWHKEARVCVYVRGSEILGERI